MANFFGVIIYLLTSFSWKVRSRTAAAVKRLNAVQEDLSPILVRAMWDLRKLVILFCAFKVDNFN